MFYYRCNIQYQGTHYAGVQWQNGAKTVQGEINDALAKFIYSKYSTSIASRTDSGVHALQQVIKISVEHQLDLSTFLKTIALFLPSDIIFLSIDECDWSYRPSLDCVSKEYRYFFTNRIHRDDLAPPFIANIANPLDIELMKHCATLIVGTHDFCNFCSTGSNVKSTIRTIFNCELSEIDPSDLFKDQSLFIIPPNFNSCYQLRIVGNGFLKQMVRHLMRGLWMVGTGKISPNQFQTYLDGPKAHQQLWKVAPANGLFLYQIFNK